MKQFLIRFLFLLILAAGMAQTSEAGELAKPAHGAQFDLALDDGTTTKAIYLSSGSLTGYVVYSTPTGQIGLLTTTSGSGTTPPTPSPTPSPPPKPEAKEISVITITASEPATLETSVAARMAELEGKFFAFTITQVSEGTTSANALKWIGLSAGKNYPYSFVAAKDGTILWEGPTPDSAAAFLSILNTSKKPDVKPKTCQGKRCP